jgi:hypothetical protein
MSGILRLALLAPDLVEAILGGRGGDSLVLESLAWSNRWRSATTPAREPARE